jgi:hypothetical protein
MTGENQETVNISLTDLEALQRLAVVESGHKILVGDFQKSRDHLNEILAKIFEKVDSIPGKVTDCKETLEKDINEKYMSKEAGKLLEQRLTSSTRSIKLWIVSTVTGASATGVFILWFFKLIGT